MMILLMPGSQVWADLPSEQMLEDSVRVEQQATNLWTEVPIS